MLLRTMLYKPVTRIVARILYVAVETSHSEDIPEYYDYLQASKLLILLGPCIKDTNYKAKMVA
jgi:hypothetical protein